MTQPKVAGICLVCNEADIIGYTLRHMASEGLDLIIVADSMSIDGTHKVLEAAKKEITTTEILIVHDKIPGFYQSQKMSALAKRAAALGAMYIIPFDADELFYSFGDKNVADAIREADADVIGVPEWTHIPTQLDDEQERNPYSRMTWRKKEACSFDKVIARYHDDLIFTHGNYGVMFNEGPQGGVAASLGIRHFPYRDVGQFTARTLTAKHGYAQAPKLAKCYGAHKRYLIRILEDCGQSALAYHYYHEIFMTDPTQQALYDPAPYCRRKHE
jgi:glycosyltransferase involved in cell wall biosynthesis